MKKVIINGTSYLVDEMYESFEFHQKPSSNVAFFGFNKQNWFFIQFQNGGAYMYDNVPREIIDGALTADSIGKYYRAEIASKFTSTKLINKVVNIDPDTCIAPSF